MRNQFYARKELKKVKTCWKALPGQLKKEITFKYDGLGRRIEKMVVNTTSPEKSYTRKYFYDGQNIVEEKNASNQTVATYLHTLGIDDPVLMERNNEVYVYTKDGLGSIKELTKPDGKVTQRYRYSAYGEITRELLENRPNKDLVENSYTYTGREFEEETGLYYYRARYYDAELGRFISEDPIGFGGGSINLYSYVDIDPINYLDPLGLSPQDIRSAIEIVKKEIPDLEDRASINIDPSLPPGVQGVTKSSWFGRNQIGLNQSYLKCLSNSEKLDLLDTIFHEGFHSRDSTFWNIYDGIKSFISPYGITEYHYDIYKQANELTDKYSEEMLGK